MPEEDRLLGTARDHEIARRINRTPLSVVARRRKLGIPNRFSAVRRWTIEEKVLLGTAPDQQVARRINRALHAVQAARWLHKIPVFNSKSGKCNPKANEDSVPS